MSSAVPHRPAPGEDPLLTLRVSRDSGRRWGREKRYYEGDCEPIENLTYPPCKCPRHRGGRP